MHIQTLTLKKAKQSPADLLVDEIGKEELSEYDTVIISKEVYEKMKLDKNWKVEDDVWIRDFGNFGGRIRPETCFKIKEMNGKIYMMWLDYGITYFYEFSAKRKEKIIEIV